MKTARDRYIEQHLTDPIIQCAYENELKALSEKANPSSIMNRAVLIHA